MSESRAPLDSFGAIVAGLYPWLRYVRKAADKGLSFLTSGGPLHLQGDKGDPGALSTADTGGRLVKDSVTGTLYYSPSATAAYVAVATCIGAPLPATPGTTIALGPGSAKVTVSP